MPEFGDYAAELEAHASTHEDGGDDEVSVEALSGELADDQPTTWTKVSSKPSTFTPATHASMHENGGAGEISVAGLSGDLADKQDADKIQGRDVLSNAPSDEDALVWNDTPGRWEPTDQGIVTAHTGLSDKEVAGVIDHANASVSTAKLAADAVSQVVYDDQTADISTTSATFASTNVLCTITTTGGDVVLLVSFTAYCSAQGTVMSARINRDSGDEYVAMGDIGSVQADILASTGCMAYFTGLSAAEHTFDLEWRRRTGSHTIVCNASSEPTVFASRMIAIELKR